ncbi:MAG: proteasome accessory factor PafA2 family protein [Longimicrobiales bacterium]
MNRSLCVPKLCGADVELGNFILGPSTHGDSGAEAARALLSEVARLAGVPLMVRSSGTESTYDPQDWARCFLPGNGGCAYIDLDHLEICLPEVVSAWDHVAAWHALLRIAHQAQRAANQDRPPERRIQVLVNNSDGRGHSYGSHLNLLVSRSAWDNIVNRKPHYLAFLASFQSSSLILTGQGKVGSENDAPGVNYQISQRADFVETLTGTQTTVFRPLVNTRDEALCGRYGHQQTDLARLHVIFHDSTLCHVASLLKVGTMQIVLAMIEAGQVDSTLALEDPLSAVWQWSHDPSLRTRAPRVCGGALTAVELQRRFLDAAARFVASGATDGIVPRAQEIVELWEDTLNRLATRDWAVLAGRLDWVLKLSLIERVLRQRPELHWDSPEIKHLDHMYASLDPEDGLFWSLERHGLIERVVSEEEIARFTREPPADTRAWGRAMLQRRAGDNAVKVDWDVMRVRVPDSLFGSTTWRVDLGDPFAWNRNSFESVASTAHTLQELLRGLGAECEAWPGTWQHTQDSRSVGWAYGPSRGASLARSDPSEWQPHDQRGDGGNDGSS